MVKSAAMMKAILALVVVVPALAACGGSDSTPKQLFTPKPECKGDPVTPYMGRYPQVIDKLGVGLPTDGFDLNGDGKPDNKLGGVSSLAQSAIDNSIANYEIVIPLEMFDEPTVAEDSCVKFPIYLGKFDPDSDGDGKRPGISGGDCNDKDPTVGPGMPEIPGNFKDDDCDGKVDEDASGNPSTDTMDHDGDGVTIAAGDCDDTNPMVHPGMAEICGDGLDNDCDGVADRSVDGSGNVTACSAYAPDADIPLDPRSFDMSGKPAIAFTDGTISKTLQLEAGPSKFDVTIPVTGGITLDLAITGATIQGDVQPDGTIKNGKLGGVLDARTADNIRGLDISQIMLTPNDSLLDATFANILGSTLLQLPLANEKIQKMYPGCRTPDIDVDGDGLEAFCSSNPDATDKVADVCIDGDGTVIKSTYDSNGNILTHCAQAVDKNGKPRFVDGISVELNFTTTAIHSIQPPAP